MFSSLVVGYLFCGGAGAGACAVLAVLGLFVPRGRIVAGDAASFLAVPSACQRLFCPATTVAFGAAGAHPEKWTVVL